MSTVIVAAESPRLAAVVYWLVVVPTPVILLGVDRLVLAQDRQMYLRANRFVLDAITKKTGLAASFFFALIVTFPAFIDFIYSLDAWFDFRTRRDIAVPGLVALLMRLWLDCILLVAVAYLYAVCGDQVASSTKKVRAWLEEKTPRD